MDKLFSEYSKQEKGMLTEQEFKEICLYEIENNPDAPVELYTSYVNMIDIGAFKNPFSVNESPTSLFWKLPLAVVAMNTLIGNIVRTKYYIPILSDITPLLVEVHYLNGRERMEVISRKRAGDINKRHEMLAPLLNPFFPEIK